MSTGWVCDKCNRHFLQDSTENRYHIAAWTYGARSPESEINLDLCEKCKQHFDKWFEDKPYSYYLGSDFTFEIETASPIPEGIKPPYGWPTFEDGTPIKEWDEVLDQHGHGFVAHNFHYYGKRWTVSSGHGYGVTPDTGVFKRPTKEQMAYYYKKWPSEREQAYSAKIRFKEEIGWVADGALQVR